MLFDIREFREGILRSNSSVIPIPQLRRLFTQLQGPEVAEAFREIPSSTKTLDIRKFLDFLQTWMANCRLRDEMKFPIKVTDAGTQEDAADFLLTCILNKLTPELLNPLSLKYTNRREYRNGRPNETMTNLIKNASGRVIGTKPFESPLTPLNLIPYRASKSVDISQLINEYFHILNKNNTTGINQMDHVVVREMPNYFLFSMNRNLMEFKRGSVISTKINTNVNLESTVSIEGTPYNLYSVVVHIGETVNSGHYFYLFKETSDTWIVLNDSRIYTLTNADFLKNYQNKVILVSYKRAIQDVRIPKVDDVRALVAYEEEINNVDNMPLLFLLGKTVYNSKTFTDYEISDIEIKDGKLIGIQVRKGKNIFPKDGGYYQIQYFIFPFETLSEDQQIELMGFTSDTNNFMFQTQSNINSSVAKKLSESFKGGRVDRKRGTRKVEARKRKSTRKA